MSVGVSEYRTFQECQERHRLSYGLDRWPIRASSAPSLGTYVHALLAGQRASIEDPYQRALGDAMVRRHDARWGALAMERTEVEFDFDGIRGTIDGIMRVCDETYIMEHKTTSLHISDGSLYWRMVGLNAQVSVYLWAAQNMGLGKISGCVYNVLRKPVCRPHMATPAAVRKYTKGGLLYANQRDHDETPEEYGARCEAEMDDDHFARRTLTRTEGQMYVTVMNMRTAAERIRGLGIVAQRDRSDQACVGKYGECPYLPVCLGEAGIDDPDLYRGGPR